MEPGINIQSQKGMSALYGFGKQLSKTSLEKPLLHLFTIEYHK